MSKLHYSKSEGPQGRKTKEKKMELSITKPDDWHLHLRDGDLLEAVVSHRSFNSYQDIMGITFSDFDIDLLTNVADLIFTYLLKILVSSSSVVKIMFPVIRIIIILKLTSQILILILIMFIYVSDLVFHLSF